MRIGELAQATGISVRTLHHYEEIGLLKPADRSEAGHRIYTDGDVERLHKIVSLRNIGFSLREIGNFLGKTQTDLRDLTTRQLEKIDAELEELERRKWCLKAVTEASQWAPHNNTDKLLHLIREITIQSRYFSSDERRALEAREDSLGVEQTKAMHTKLAELTDAAQELMDAKVLPSDPRAISLANEWMALGKEGVGDNPQIAEKIKVMVKENPDLASYRGITPSLLQFLQAAIGSRQTKDPDADR